MIGLIVPLTEGMVLCIPLLFLLIGIRMRQSDDSRHRALGQRFLVFGALLGCVSLTLTVQRMRDRHAIADLDSQSVARIQVDAHTITEASAITRLLDGLQTYEPYLPDHEGVLTRTLHIQTTDGRLRSYAFAPTLIHTRPGIVVQLSPTTWIFSVELQGVFEELGINGHIE